jgi:hypothetical protein
MVKLTKRKGFNFFRSYYDVYNELSDKDKVAFMDALLDRQFQGIKPTGLSGMAMFAYISQTNSIDSQVKGYEDKTKNILTPTVGGAGGGAYGGSDTPTPQVEEKGKEEEQDVYPFDSFWKDYDKSAGLKAKIEKKWDKLSDESKLLIKQHLPKYKKAQPNKKYRKDPSTYLNNESWNDEIITDSDSEINYNNPTLAHGYDMNAPIIPIKYKK